MLACDRSRRAAAALALASTLTTGCGRDAAAPAAGVTPPDEPRIVSISPAISQTLVDLGMGPYVIGRSAFCRSLDERIPVVGDLLDVDHERLVRLHPTHVLVQPPAAGFDETLAALAGEHGWVVRGWHLDGIEDVRRLIEDLPGTVFPPGTSRHDAAAARADRLLASIDEAMRPLDDRAFTGRTLLVHSLSPLGVFGRGTYLDEILVALGGRNATDTRGWAVLSLEDVVRLDPEAIVVVTSGEADGDTSRGSLMSLDVAAARDGRIVQLVDPRAQLPSSALAEVAAELRAILQRLGEQPP